MVKDRSGDNVILSISKLLDVEEHVWSPMYGLKGNIDATVEAVMKDKDEEKTLVVPFELKTGRNDYNTSHLAQTALYTLLLSDRYGEAPIVLKTCQANTQQMSIYAMVFCTILKSQ